MYNLTIPENCSSNCFDSIIYSLLKYNNFDYEAYNIKYFYTEYYNNINPQIYRSKSNIYILKDIYNINLKYIQKNESNEIIFKNDPVGIVIDPYYCYWSPFYQKSHYTHVFLVIDVDYHNKQYVCFDVHYNTRGYIKVNFDVIHDHYIQYITIDFSIANEVKTETILNKINTLINDFDNNIKRKKTELINYFINGERKILFPENIETSIPLINLMWIAEDKRHSKILFKYLENKIEDMNFFSVYELLSTSEHLFLYLKFILMKYAKTGKLKEESLINIINQIFDTDVLIIQELKKILGDSL